MISLIEVTSENFQSLQSAILSIEKVSFPNPWSLAAFKEEMRNPLSHVWAAESDAGLVGYACFWMFAGEIHVLNIAVDPKERGKGIGRYLLERMIRFGVSNKVKVMWLEVRPSNAVARALYQRAGFVEISRRPRYYTDTNEDAIVMSLNLSSGNGEQGRVNGERDE